MLDFKFAVDLLGFVAARRLHFFFRVEDAEEALGVNQGVVHVVEDALQLRDGGDDIAEQHHVVHDLTDGHARIAFQHKVGGEDDDQHRAHLFHEALHAVVVKRYLTGFHLVFSDLILYVKLFLAFNLFAVEALDDVDGVDDVFDALALGLEVRAHLTAPAFQTAGLAVGNPEIDGNDA